MMMAVGTRCSPPSLPPYSLSLPLPSPCRAPIETPGSLGCVSVSVCERVSSGCVCRARRWSMVRRGLGCGLELRATPFLTTQAGQRAWPVFSLLSPSFVPPRLCLLPPFPPLLSRAPGLPRIFPSPLPPFPPFAREPLSVGSEACSQCRRLRKGSRHRLQRCSTVPGHCPARAQAGFSSRGAAPGAGHW